MVGFRGFLGIMTWHDVAEEKEAALKREREEALKRAENEMTDLERRGVRCVGKAGMEFMAFGII
jgi:hypothetical protein